MAAPWPRRARRGDHLVVDDRSGFTFWSSDTQKEWNGLRVGRKYWEARHPQDFVRGVPDRVAIVDGRAPPDVDSLPNVGPRTTRVAIAAGPGEYGLVVDSIDGIDAGEWLRVTMDDGNVFTVRVVSAPIRIDSTRFLIDDPVLLIDSPYSIELASPLPGSAAVGNFVVNISNT